MILRPKKYPSITCLIKESMQRITIDFLTQQCWLLKLVASKEKAPSTVTVTKASKMICVNGHKLKLNNGDTMLYSLK